ncbi:MAG TPA: hypothetical protein VE693_13240 [Gaiellaceae bacterium]|nr:hypothetical protein [Gaiellaceae bacterium]
MSGEGIQLGQYTGAWMRLARRCHPGRDAGGQIGALAATFPLVVVGAFDVEPPSHALAATMMTSRTRTHAVRRIAVMIAEGLGRRVR